MFISYKKKQKSIGLLDFILQNIQAHSLYKKGLTRYIPVSRMFQLLVNEKG